MVMKLMSLRPRVNPSFSGEIVCLLIVLVFFFFIGKRREPFIRSIQEVYKKAHKAKKGGERGIEESLTPPKSDPRRSHRICITKA